MLEDIDPCILSKKRRMKKEWVFEGKLSSFRGKTNSQIRLKDENMVALLRMEGNLGYMPVILVGKHQG